MTTEAGVGVMYFEDGNMEPRIEECTQPLQASENVEVNSSLELPEE